MKRLAAYLTSQCKLHDFFHFMTLCEVTVCSIIMRRERGGSEVLVNELAAIGKLRKNPNLFFYVQFLSFILYLIDKFKSYIYGVQWDVLTDVYNMQ